MSRFQSVTAIKNGWYESLTFFLPKNIKPFLLVVLKSFKETYSALIYTPLFWIVIVLYIFFYLLGTYGLPYGSNPIIKPALPAFMVYLHLSMLSYLFVLFLSASRPSVNYKDTSYFNYYILVSVKIFAGIVLFMYVPYALLYNQPLDGALWLTALILFFAPVSQGNSVTAYREKYIIFTVISIMFFYFFDFQLLNFKSPSFVLYLRNLFLHILMIDESNIVKYTHFLNYFISPFIVFCGLFILDAQKDGKEYVKAVSRAAKMLLYNYPFCFIIYIVTLMCITAEERVIHWLFENSELSYTIGKYSLLLITVPFYLCLLTTFYIKRLHDQFDLYYKQR